MTAPPTDNLDALLAFNRQVLMQALDLVHAQGSAKGLAYARPLGSHLRHVIEHHEALLSTPAGAVVDYDGRPRDRQLETDPLRAAERLLVLLHQLSDRAGHPDTTLIVRGQCGLDGSAAFTVRSSLGRELAFVASHAIHHFALLLPHMRQQGLPLPADFGLAPGTVAHHRFTASATTATPFATEIPCTPTPLPA